MIQMTTDSPEQSRTVAAPEENDGFAGRIFSARQLRRQVVLDILFKNVTRLCAVFILCLLAAILYALGSGAALSMKTFGFHFFTNAEWDPVAQNFGAVVPIFGTIVTSFIALLIAIPVSFGIAIFLTELSPRSLRGPLGTAIELLAGIPSIIYGMWGLFIFAPFFAKNVEPFLTGYLGRIPFFGALFQGPPMGIGVLTAAQILSIMIIPFISAVMRDVFEVVPPLLKESAYGLGATTWEVAWNVVVPHTKVGVIGGIMLGLGRALGETMAVTFVIGNAHALSASILAPGNTISSSLANEFTEAVGDLYTSSLIELGLILFLITFVVLAGAQLLLLRMKKQEGGQ
jgi:phosphate transport system permease protein